MNFASDNGAGVAPEILEAIAASSRVNAPAYGADEYTARAQALLSEVFETEVAAFLVATGTAANALALAALVNPWDAVFCHEEAHIHDDECGAPEFFAGGAKLVGIAGEGGKITPDGLRETLERFPRGLVKSVAAGRAVVVPGNRSRDGLQRERSFGAQLDRASEWDRRSYGRRALRQRAGIRQGDAGRNDVAGRGRHSDASARRKMARSLARRSCFSIPRARRISPFSASGADRPCPRGASLARRWRPTSRMGFGCGWPSAQTPRRVGSAAALAATPGVRLAWPTEANEVFVVAPNAMVERWRAAGARFHEWSTRSLAPERAPRKGETLVRLVTSFETEPSEIDRLVERLRRRPGLRRGLAVTAPHSLWQIGLRGNPGARSDDTEDQRSPAPLLCGPGARRAYHIRRRSRGDGPMAAAALAGRARPATIEQRLEAQGYLLIAPLQRRPMVYLADVSAGPAGYQRLVIDAWSGKILQRFVAPPRRWGPALAARDEEFGAPPPPGFAEPGPSGGFSAAAQQQPSGENPLTADRRTSASLPPISPVGSRGHKAQAEDHRRDETQPRSPCRRPSRRKTAISDKPKTAYAANGG